MNARQASSEGRQRGSFATPIAVAAAIVLTAPLIGDLRDALNENLDKPAQVRLFGGLLGLALFGLVATAVRSIRDRYWERYSFALLGLTLIAYQALVLSRGRPEEAAVERMHIVLYGLLGLVTYRSLRARDESTSTVGRLLQTALIAALVGCVDEGVQWFVAVRVGDAYDVLLNVLPGLAGALLGRGLWGGPVGAGRRGLARGTAGLAAVVVLLATALLDRANLGHPIVDDSIGRFWSRFTAEELVRLDEARSSRWGGVAPRVGADFRFYDIEDHFLTEAAWHVQARNGARRANNSRVALREQQILERYYPSVLQLKRPDGSWRYQIGPHAREKVEREGRAALALDPTPFESGAAASRIWASPSPRQAWLGGGGVALLLALFEFAQRRAFSRDSLGASPREPGR